MTTTDTDIKHADNVHIVADLTVKLTLSALATGDAQRAAETLLAVNWDPELRDLVALRMATVAHAALAAFAAVLGQTETHAIDVVLQALNT